MHFAKLWVLGHSELLMVVNVDKRNIITFLIWLKIKGDCYIWPDGYVKKKMHWCIMFLDYYTWYDIGIIIPYILVNTRA